MDEQQKTKSFFKLFIENENRIYTFILMLVPNKADANDIFQETSMVMWDKFNEFEEGTSFANWGRKIAYNKIMNFRVKNKNSRVCFNAELMDAICNKTGAVLDEIDPRLTALRECIRKLSDADRQLIKMHFEDGITIKKIALTIDRSAHGLYKVMARIYNQLSQCVRREIKI